MNTTQIGVDLAKSVFEVAVSHIPGRVHERHRLSRTRFRRFFADRAPTEVLLEACSSAHHWGRELQALGHRVALLPAADVARYRDGNKTDRADAKALLEAARNEAIDRVPVKSVEQQALSALHRLRQGYLQTRTARINALRGHLREFGVTIPLGAAQVLPRARAALAEERLPILTATALLAFVGDIHRFRSGRDFAAYLGLTPREHSSALSRRLGGITKHGNSYLRMLLIHGARSALRAGHVAACPDDLRTWALALQHRKGHNIAAVALANKLARVCWRVWRDQRPFERRDAA